MLLTRQELRVLDDASGDAGLLLGQGLEVVQAADEEQVGNLLDDLERVGDAAGPEGIPDPIDEIAQQDRWSRPQILDRAQALAARAISIWPAPALVSETADTGISWDLMTQALTALPAGSWTTYGDLAALIGSHPVPVGMRLASHPTPNAHCVLQVEGTVSPNFRWLESDRSDDPRDLLRAEGVHFDDHGRASPAQRISTEELAALCSVTADAATGLPDPDSGQDEALRDSFVEQLAAAQSPGTVHGVLAVLASWTADGGRLEYGRAEETSCFLMARVITDPGGSIWPLALYPSGKAEVVFQHLTNRSPFDDQALREELRVRLNQIPGVDLPAAKLELRPGFDLALLANREARTLMAEHLHWFLEKATGEQE